MNSEELEQSLKTEFEGYLKQVFADVQQEMSDFQGKIEQEFERHRTHLTEALRDFSARAVQTERELDPGFRESVVEHLRLSRDEGARITAMAIAEAEDMEKEAADASASASSAADASASSAGFSQMRDGINDICSQTSQAAILKSLVAHAEQFTPRGAFFIVKNEHLVGWRVFGREENLNAEAVREIFLPVANDSTLGESIKTLNAVESTYGVYAGDSDYLDKLGFGAPEKMIAIPLVARGRGVAVLYADQGSNGEQINLEALETLVRVAGLTVEVLAAAAPSAKQAPAVETQPKTDTAAEQPAEVEEQYAHTEQEQTASDERAFEASDDVQAADNQVADDVQAAAEEAEEDARQSYESEAVVGDEQTAETAVDAGYQTESFENDYAAEPSYQTEEFDSAREQYPVSDYAVEESRNDFETPAQPEEEIIEAVEIVEEEFQPAYRDETAETESYSWNQPAETTAPATDESSYGTVAEAESGAAESEDYSSVDASNQYQFEEAQSFESSVNQPDDAPSIQSPDGAEAVPAAFDSSFNVDAIDATPAPAAKPAKSRFSDKNIDLPVEVTEDERRLHNDARRFARLLVSEIKLYNEEKVAEGRTENDLYERLREAIDRSREMYDKRVQPPVAAKFDYFHYELVNSLAEGDAVKLGESYANAVV